MITTTTNKIAEALNGNDNAEKAAQAERKRMFLIASAVCAALFLLLLLILREVIPLFLVAIALGWGGFYIWQHRAEIEKGQEASPVPNSAPAPTPASSTAIDGSASEEKVDSGLHPGLFDLPYSGGLAGNEKRFPGVGGLPPLHIGM